MRDFEFTSAWQRELYPRRGSLGVEALVPAPQARARIEAYTAEVREHLDRVVQASGSEIREAAQAWLAGDPDTPPLGAAAIARALMRHRTDLYEAPFADAWIAERGLRFAAEAAVELLGLTVPHEDIRFLGPGRGAGWYFWRFLQVQWRVRAALAGAPEAEYAAIVEVLAGLRSRSEYHRMATSLLVPTETAWVQESLDLLIAEHDPQGAVSLILSLSTRQQLERVDGAFGTVRGVLASSAWFLAGVVDFLGRDAVEVLMRWFDGETAPESRQRLLEALAQIPDERVLRVLADRATVGGVEPVLLEAAGRLPGPALGVLAVGGDRRKLDELLRLHVRRHRELAAGQVATLPAEAAGRVRALLDEFDAITEAPTRTLPPLLVSPPWLHRVKAPRPVVLEGLSATDEPVVTWREGEQETFGRRSPDVWSPYSAGDSRQQWEQRAGELRENLSRWEAPSFLIEAPFDLAAPLVAGWVPGDYSDRSELRPIAARFGIAALPALMCRAPGSPVEVAAVLGPFFSPAVAVRMADWLTRLKSVRGMASAWLLRRPLPAARALVPPALGKAGAPRRQAENALLLMASHGHADAVRSAGRDYGDEAAAAIEVLLARDPLMDLPARIPALASWARTERLPQPRLRDGSGVLPASAVEHLITVFALSRIEQPYAGLEIVRQSLAAPDLPAFAWALFGRWLAEGAVAKENWVLDGLALAGDDEVVRKLTPLILAWPGEGGHARAVAGVNVLAAIGSDVSLMHLHTIAQRAKFKGLKNAAQEKMGSVAADLGLTADQLADRVVPGLGLAADGTTVLDYGPRQFVVGFDEQLRPFVTYAAGKRLKNLPKPGAKDDPDLAPAAYQQFSALKKDVRKIGADAILRLEQAMVRGRRWSGAEFRQLFVGHPLLGHVVRRLVWGLYDADGHLTGALRVAEDRTFADVLDDEVLLADDAVIGVAHPLPLGSQVAPWAELFADYELLQPFPQLARPVHTLTGPELETGILKRFEGSKIPAAKVLGLERRGWRREAPMDAGIQGSIDISFPSGVTGTIALDPGFVIGMPTEWEEQTLDLVRVHASGTHPFSREDHPLQLGPVDRLAVSEILNDLTGLTE
ncbi:DUF4132 domain-containing protein [Kineosporia sp. NBRC 101731]|uniref:DUF4132 domain-containing protein n=1 Tax=Kineosporia sp. NBRC 101731 TaxID=3032199 RepID=UPI0024A1347D|nr:DUF4132 domain-containing protein [Kineosporia sp. NBRC 101731]GLY32646.1 hypothetical protein Kisp02_60110 [Kineosporia sp. NBRC 101731]